MDITFASSDTLKVKTKASTFLVHTGNNFSIFFENSSVVLSGPGDYEVKGIKIAGLGKANLVGFFGKIDNLNICITKSSLIKQAKDQFGEYNLVLLEEDEIIDQTLFAAFNANVVIVFGSKAQDHLKTLGKEVLPVSKFSISKDKLPAEMEVVLLQ